MTSIRRNNYSGSRGFIQVTKICLHEGVSGSLSRGNFVIYCFLVPVGNWMFSVSFVVIEYWMLVLIEYIFTLDTRASIKLCLHNCYMAAKTRFCLIEILYCDRDRTITREVYLFSIGKMMIDTFKIRCCQQSVRELHKAFF